MEQVIITCEQNGKSLKADVLSKTQNHMKVAIVGSTMVLEMHKHGNSYEGKAAGLTFESNGEIVK